MKILFIGEIGLGQTSLMRLRALKRLGHEVRGVHTIEPWMKTSWMKRQIQRRLQRGSIVDEINRRVLNAARVFRPNLVWAEKQEFLRVETINMLRKIGARSAFTTGIVVDIGVVTTTEQQILLPDGTSVKQRKDQVIIRAAISETT